MADFEEIHVNETPNPCPHGLLVVDKPPGPTSYDVIRFLRRTCEIDKKWKIGHLGTLDPFASGVVVIALGQAVKYFEYALGLKKTYRARLWLGDETDTLDPTGKVVASADVPSDWKERLNHAVSRFTGEISQIPPVFSAKHVDGERAYKGARRGEEVKLEPVTVQIYAFEIGASGDFWVDFTCTVSGGTYLRAIARDLAREIGTVGHLVGLERLAVGPYDDTLSIPFEAFERGGNPVLKHHLRPVTGILERLPKIFIKLGPIVDDKISTGKELLSEEFEDESGALNGLDDKATLVIMEADGRFRSMGRYRAESGGVTPFKPWVC
jgi:tRNA pseudouridine55 synthase